MKYQRIRYPDGQISVKIQEYGDFTIKERINSYEDLFFVKSIVDASFIKYLDLFIPCLFGQRSDRRFSENQSFDLKLIADFINSCNFRKVTVLDPHSDVSLALLNNSVKESSYGYVLKSMVDLQSKGYTTNDIMLISPDAGAYKKVFQYGEILSVPVAAANKFRDLEGNVSLKFVGDVKDKVCLIVDDICDGGYTFYLLSKALREQGAKKVYLYVTHGYFSKWFKTRLEITDENSSLIKCLDGIYCTNSVKDITNEYYDGMNMKSLNGLVTQFKVV